MCQLPYEVYGLVQDSLEVNVQCGIVLNTLSCQTFTCKCYTCFFFHKLLVLNNNKKAKFCFNKMVLHPTSGNKCSVPEHQIS